MGNADQLQQMILVLDPLHRIAADQVFVSTYRKPQPLAVAGIHQLPGLIRSEILVIQVRRHVVGPGAIPPEHAELHALSADRLGVMNDFVERTAWEGRGHDPDRIIHRGVSFTWMSRGPDRRLCTNVGTDDVALYVGSTVLKT